MGKCNCFSDILDRMKSQVIEQIPEAEQTLEINWEGYAFFFSGDFVPVNPKIVYSYRGNKKDGTPKANRTKGEARLLCDYCPFCGRKLEKGGA